MSETAAAQAKPAGRTTPIVAKAPEAQMSTHREQKLREAQLKRFRPSSLQEIGQDFALLAVKVPNDWTMEDVLNPTAWAAVAPMVAKDALNTRRDKIGSLIYARREDGAFKTMLEIKAVTTDHLGQPNGLMVEPWF